MKQRLYRLLIEPRTAPTDERRREFILNALLAVILILNALATSLAAFNTVTGATDSAANVVANGVFFFAIISLIVVSRRGHPWLAAILFQALLLIGALFFITFWSYRLAEAELLFALAVLIAGVLFTARFALIISLTAIGGMLVIASLQIADVQQPYIAWQTDPFVATDLPGYIALLVAMGMVSWLSNRETDRSLQRARSSEQALARQRDQLEIKVAERTKQLEDLQASRLLELQPFAELGRISAGLVHDIANPLTAASLQLEELNRQQQSDLVRQVQRSLHQLERYLLSARKQIRRESQLQDFSAGSETRQIVRLLMHRARRAGVGLKLQVSGKTRVYGDVAKFDQIMANVIANAIDASKDNGQSVVISVAAEGRMIVITVTDHGHGIKDSDLKHIFEPFYTTKQSSRNNLGIGLAMVKQYVETDFAGSISVDSKPGEQTRFTITLMGGRK